MGQANTLLAMGDMDQQAYEQALALFRQVGAGVGEASTLKAMGGRDQQGADG